MTQLPDDWLMEVDILQSVYMDQLKLKDDSKSVEISIWPNPDIKDEGENQVGIMFTCGFRKDYPNEAPDMNFRTLRGVTSKQLKELTEKVETHAQELLGMQMLFPLAQLVKDWLDEQNMDNISKQKEASRAKDELEAEQEKEEYARKYKDGTVVTVESFRGWWDKFLPARPEKPQWPVADPNTPVVPKLTGKQLFERGALSIMDLEALSLTASTSSAPNALAASSSSLASSSSSNAQAATGAGAGAGAAPQDLSLFEDVGDLPDDLDDE